MPGEIVDVLLVTESAVAQRKAALRHLAAAWFDAVDYLRSRPDDAASRVAPREGLTSAGYLLALQGTKVLGRLENADWLSGQPPRLDAHIRSLAEAMARAGLASTLPSISHQVSTGQFVQ
jgi:NitT/TauT family transport system substrate-binding protein